MAAAKKFFYTVCYTAAIIFSLAYGFTAYQQMHEWGGWLLALFFLSLVIAFRGTKSLKDYWVKARIISSKVKSKTSTHSHISLFMFHLMAIVFATSCSQKIIIERITYFPKQAETVMTMPKKENVWVFIMAGQSNMAGRGIVEKDDTVPNKRILSVNNAGRIVVAKEPLHFYEPNLTGLDCGVMFARTLIKNIPDSISILIIPTAVGGSSISQWLGDSTHRGVALLSNFRKHVEIGKEFGVIKGILWHQGESDANERNIPHHKKRMGELFSKFRAAIGNDGLPLMVGELGSFSDNPANFSLINRAIHAYAAEDANCSVISTKDLKDKGDHLHFNSKGQRAMGKRFATAYLKFL